MFCYFIKLQISPSSLYRGYPEMGTSQFYILFKV